jgi:hypothetical protein
MQRQHIRSRDSSGGGSSRVAVISELAESYSRGQVQDSSCNCGQTCNKIFSATQSVPATAREAILFRDECKDWDEVFEEADSEYVLPLSLGIKPGPPLPGMSLRNMCLRIDGQSGPPGEVDGEPS